MGPVPIDPPPPPGDDLPDAGWLVDAARRAAGEGVSTVRFEALGVMDGVGTLASPGAVLVQFEPPSPKTFNRWTARVLASGRLLDIALHEAPCAVVRRPREVLLPGLVNAHTHLDLTHVGPRPHDPDQGFAAWIRTIAPTRPIEPEAIAASVRAGVALAVKGGTVAVGDIAGAVGRAASLLAFDAARDSGLAGVSYLEFFAAGARETIGLAALDRTIADAAQRGLLNTNGNGAAQEPGAAMRLGIQPHAPYSVSPAAYRHAATVAAAFGVPLATHLAESLDERDLCRRADGPLRTFLEDVGVWTADFGATFGGRSSVARLADHGVLSHIALAAHVNDADEDDIALLAAAGTNVVYCPRAWSYFGHARTLGDHPWRRMLDAGVPVALGTDSIINLPSDTPRVGIGVLDEMRHLWSLAASPAGHSAAALAQQLLAMGTVHGARALGLDPESFTLRVGAQLAGLVGVEVVEPGQRPPIAVPPEEIGRNLLHTPGDRLSNRPKMLFARTFFGQTGTRPVPPTSLA